MTGPRAATHTPTTLAVQPRMRQARALLRAETGHAIATVYGYPPDAVQKGEAIAYEIARRYNAHDELVAAIETAIQNINDGFCTHSLVPLQAALQKAKGEAG